jgi:hypothetical protein
MTPNQPTGFRHPHMTPKQAKWMFDLINSRIGNGPALQGWKDRYFAIKNRADFEHAIETLKSFPVLAGDANRPAVASEEGLYRNPNDGTIYRLAKDSSDNLRVSVYSEKSRARRLMTTGEVTKRGVWKRLSVIDSKKHLTYGISVSMVKILAEWQMTDTDKVEYVTGICNFCYRGLKDDRSVKVNYGPDCAEKHGLPWGD